MQPSCLQAELIHGRVSMRISCKPSKWRKARQTSDRWRNRGVYTVFDMNVENMLGSLWFCNNSLCQVDEPKSFSEALFRSRKLHLYRSHFGLYRHSPFRNSELTQSTWQARGIPSQIYMYRLHFANLGGFRCIIPRQW